jgi:formate dehydrogenase maturation protein FdhE
VDRDFKNEVFSSFDPNPVRTTCTACGKKPSQVMSMLDPVSGRTVRMLKCDCGEQTWIMDK